MRHGSQLDPPNRFESTRTEADFEHRVWDGEFLAERADRKIEFLDDNSQTVVSKNDSPDLKFNYSCCGIARRCKVPARSWD